MGDELLMKSCASHFGISGGVCCSFKGVALAMMLTLVASHVGSTYFSSGSQPPVYGK